jgi:hypothetical protein
MGLYLVQEVTTVKAGIPIEGKKPSGFSYVAIWTYLTDEKALQMCLHLL